MLTLPKDTPRLKWTRHIKNKMVFYHLSAATVLGVFRRPERTEEGVAPETNAAMRTRKKYQPRRLLGRSPDLAPRASGEEIWIMYQIKSGKKITMISTWRYPGITKPGAPIPIPQDILTELTAAGTLES